MLRCAAAFASRRYNSNIPSPFIGSTSNSLSAQTKASTRSGEYPAAGPVDIRGKICHLVFESREGADVMDAALLSRLSNEGTKR